MRSLWIRLVRRFRASSIATVALICLAATFTMFAWALASPVGASPDDDFHLVSIYCAASGGNGLCTSTGNPETRNVAIVLLKAPCFAANSDASAACQLDGNIIKNHNLLETSRGNFTGQYPGVFYSAMSFFAQDDVESSVVAMRFFNALLFVALAGALALLFQRTWRSRLALMWVTTLVPLGLFIIPSTNPSSWAVTGIGTAFAALVGLTSARGWRKIAFSGLYVIGGVMAAGARADAAAYLILATIVALGLTSSKKSLVSPWMLLPFLGVALGAFSFFTSGQSIASVAGLVDGSAPASVHSPSAIFFGNLLNLPSLWLGVFGSWGLGWLDTQMPVIVWVGAAGVFGIFVFAALKGLVKRELAWAASVGLGLIVIPIYILQKSLAPVGAQVQPRYLLPLIVLLAGVIFLSRSNWSFSFSRLQWLLLGAALMVAQAVALFLNIRRYTSGASGGGNLNQDIGWWWPTMTSPMAVWTLGSLSFAVVVAVVLVAASTRQKEKSEAVG
jgi:hypothetical protein